jgi:predicted ATPase
MRLTAENVYDCASKPMSAPYIDRLIVENFGCVQKLDMGLTRLHALVGPNDSGKSTILRALRLATLVASPTANPHQQRKSVELARLTPTTNARIRLEIAVAGGHISFDVTSQGQAFAYELARAKTKASWEKVAVAPHLSIGSELTAKEADFTDALPAPLFFRFEPTAMRQPGGQILADRPVAFVDERGTGLAAVLQAINSRDVDAFVDIRNRARQLFPSLATVRVPLVENGAVKLQAELDDKRVVEADQISDGVLFFLAYAATQYLAPTRLLLVEEPENGLHPARIREVVAMLREFSKTSQVVMATHSPLVINELQGDEVSVVTRDRQTGTQVRRLSQGYNYAERSKAMSNGELWLTYGDPKQEDGLFEKPKPAP